MRFKKIIYKVRKYVQDEKIYKGSAPATPQLNLQYTSSFIAGLTELRYLHCMHLENAAGNHLPPLRRQRLRLLLRHNRPLRRTAAEHPD